MSKSTFSIFCSIALVTSCGLLNKAKTKGSQSKKTDKTSTETSSSFAVQLLDVKVVGDHCFGVGGGGADKSETAGNSLEIFDCGNPESVRAIKAVQYDWAGRRLFVSGQKLYVAARSAGLVILDVSNPNEPQELGVLPGDKADDFLSVSTIGETAIVANGNSGIAIIDTKDPSNPTRLSRMDIAGQTYDVAVDGGRDIAFIASSGTDGGITAVDIREPGSPKKLGSLSQYSLNATSTGSLSSISLTIVDSTTVLLVGSLGMFVIDTNSPASMSVLGSFRSDRQGWVGIVVARQSQAYVSGLWGLEVVDFSLKAKPKVIAATKVSALYGLDSSDDHVFAVSENTGLHVFD